MNFLDLSVVQLKRAVAIKERIEALNHELARLLGGSKNSGAAPTKSQTMSAAAKKKIAAAQRGRWARLRRARSTRSGKPVKTIPKKATNASANARRSAKLKAYWGAKKKAQKK